MPVTVEAVFRLTDAASDTLDKLEKKARKADESLTETGRKLDKVGDERTRQKINKTSDTVDKLGDSNTKTASKIDRAWQKIERKIRDKAAAAGANADELRVTLERLE